MWEVYEKAVRIAAKHGIKDLSNYLLYNFEDEPDELYLRIRLNVDLCNQFDNGNAETGDPVVDDVLKYYRIQRDAK